MTESILTSIKKLLGIDEAYTAFDQDIIIHINAVLSILVQMGVGLSGVYVEDKTKIWGDFIPDIAVDYGQIKSYVYLKVKLLFDPPLSAAALESINRMITEFEFRLNAQFDTSGG